MRILNENDGLYQLKNGEILAVKKEFYKDIGIMMSGGGMEFLNA